MRPIHATLVLCLVMPFAATASPLMPVDPAKQDRAGELTARIGGRTVSFPVLKSDYRVRIEGDVATVTLEQTFVNQAETPVDATYLFPLNSKAAVNAVTMRTGDDIVRAVIKRKHEAEETFETAKENGQQAALLTQLRPNMFTQELANLMPGKPVSVTLTYVQTVPKVDDAYELIVPMVVGPRYEGKSGGASLLTSGNQEATGTDNQSPTETAPDGQAVQIGAWKVGPLPAYPPVIGQNAPAGIDPERVALAIDLAVPSGTAEITSPTHELDIASDRKMRHITLARGKVIDNSDFVLRYTLAKEAEIAGAALVHRDERGGFLSVMIEPPKVPDAEMIAKRELVFVLDTSGSMTGAPIDASKQFMASALKGLRPDDRFRILSFSNTTSQMAAAALPASPGNIAAAVRYVNNLDAGGGTEMDRAINDAFDTEQPADTVRLVVFLTDGYIGNEAAVLFSIAHRIGQSRIYAFGIGNAVNRYLLEGMAEEGRGYVRYVQPGDDPLETAETLARDLKTPLLTDIEIDWKGLPVSEATPERPRDLFAGDSIRVAARYDADRAEAGTHTISIEGKLQGRPASMPVEIELPAHASSSDDANPIPLVWARERIAQATRHLTLRPGDAALEEHVTQLGLGFSLQTQFTSFVAVHDEVVNPDRSTTKDADVPVPQVKDVTVNAYPSLNLAGSSAPEPEGILGFLILLSIAIARWHGALAGMWPQWLTRRAKQARPEDAHEIVLKDTIPYRIRKDGWWLEG
ncbi:VIT domain-containing protein [Fulvimarina sp. MAC8]|uniref:VIT domain-containing protein n=1 Tax=Fulvimarina sp. MAC8 TaxID=3162874 RepID=UPI0032EFF8A2